MFFSRASVAIVAACLLAPPRARAAEPVEGEVVEVHDGDSIAVESDGARFKCRLLGIDAPELSNARLWTEMDKVSKYIPPGSGDELGAARETFSEWAGVMEAHARDVRRALAEMILKETVRLAYDTKSPRKDRYGRLLVYVDLGDTDVNAELIRQGLAIAEERFSCDRLDEYVRLWRAARAAGVGLWSASARGAVEEESASGSPPPRAPPGSGARSEDGGVHDEGERP